MRIDINRTTWLSTLGVEHLYRAVSGSNAHSLPDVTAAYPLFDRIFIWHELDAMWERDYET